MDSLKDLFQRCHERHHTPLSQQKSIIAPSFHKQNFHLTVFCALGYPVEIEALIAANIECCPLKKMSENEVFPVRYEHPDERWVDYPTRAYDVLHWQQSWGITLFTGKPSKNWHEFEFTYEAVTKTPDAVSDCLEALLSCATNPLLTMTDKGGLRFTCRIRDYINPINEGLYVADQGVPMLVIEGDNSYSLWDARKEIILGDLLRPPDIEKESVFVPINAFRNKF